MTNGYRQSRAFTDILRVYRQPLSLPDADGFVEQGAAAKEISILRGRITPKSDADVPTPVGRAGVDQMDTTDILRFHSDADIRPDDWVKLDTPGHPKRGQWFRVMGDRQIMNWRAKTAKAFLKQATRPPGVANG